MEPGLQTADRQHLQQLAPDSVLEEDFCALHLETCVEDGQGDLLVGWETVQVLHDEVVLQQVLSFDFLDQLLQTLNSKHLQFLIFLGPFVPKLHSNQLDNLAQRETIFHEMFLIIINLHNNITQTFQISLFLVLSFCNPLLNKITGKKRLFLYNRP